MKEKNLYIISGCNGAGKTTASFIILPEILQCREFINADEIAKGLSPFRPETVALEAGRIMLSRIESLLSANESFAFETTLSTRSYRNKIIEAKKLGYSVTLIYFWLSSVSLAKERVLVRVSEGGHNIEPEIIERRYYKGIKNLFSLYLPIVDGALIFDNSEGMPALLAEKTIDGQLTVINNRKYTELRSYYDNY
nr:zeta toxin family protein [uncultured Arsenicibacter sp.]